MNRYITVVTVFLLCIALNSSHAGIFVDQVGYRPAYPKYVFVNQPADSFWVIDKTSSLVQFSGKLVLWKTADPASGMTIYRGDFSGLTRTGQYFVRSSGGEESPPFVVHDTAYAQVLKMSLKSFYYQRCGTDLPPPFAGVYNRPVCHISDATFHATAESSGTIAAIGGWHDAGDYGKYVVNAGVTVGTLLLGYEMFPARFASDNVGIRESGNGVPDILDEVRFELEWLLKMQAANGGVFAKLTKTQFEGFVMPQQDTGTRYIYQIASTATGDFVGMMARAARVYGPFDSSFAQRCLAAATKGWQFLESHPTIVPSGGFRNPSGTATGEYGDSDDRDERLWAAAEMAATTGQSKYLDYYHTRYFQKGYLDNAMSWPNVNALAHLTYLFTPFQGKDSTVAGLLKSSLQTVCQKFVTRGTNSGFQMSLVAGEFWWGSNSGVLNNAVLLVAGYEQFGTVAFRDAAIDQLHYILGVNPYAMSYITGIGARRPMNIHHRPSGSDGIAEPVPGLLAGGPDQNREDAVLAGRFTSSTPPALCYADDQGSYASNEICINWNAPLVFVAGYFAHASSSTGVQGGGNLVPGAIWLGQNYPNPFNPGTAISFQLTAVSLVTLEVFDVLGRKVATLVDGTQSAGRQTIRWDASASPSGVYFYRLQVGDFVGTRKMVVLR